MGKKNGVRAKGNKIHGVQMGRTTKVGPEEVVPENPMEEALQRVGITADDLARRLVDELNYEAPIRIVTKTGRGKTAKVNVEIKRLDSPAAVSIRQKARQDAHKLCGHYPPERSELGGIGGGAIPVKMYDFDDSNFPPPKE